MTDLDKLQAITHARMIKASKLAGFLWGYTQDGIEVTGAKVRAFTADHRRTTEFLCGVRPSSDETWELVAQIVDGMAMPKCDPFEGLT